MPRRVEADVLTPVLDPANYVFNGASLPVLLVASLIIALGVVVLIGERGSLVSLSFSAMTAGAALWLFSYGVAYSTGPPSAALWWFKLGHLGVVTIPLLIFLFTLTMLRNVRANVRWLGLAVAGAAVFNALAWGHPDFIRGVAKFSWGYYPQYGWVSAPFLLWFFGLLARSLWLYQLEHRRTPSAMQKARVRALQAAFAFGYLGSVDYIACYGVPLYPLGYLAVFGYIVLVARAIWRYRLTDFTPAFAADTIVETMNEALIVCDAERMIRYVNAAACAMFRYAASDLVGQPIERLVRGQEDGVARLRALLACEMVQDQELVCRTRAGEPVEVSCSAARLRHKPGERPAAGTVILARDIRERKRAEQKTQQLTATVHRRAEQLTRAYQELKRTQTLLVQAEKMAAVGQLASGTAHEVRNPLSIIKLGAEQLEHLVGQAADARVGDILGMMIEAVLRADRIIRSLLDFSRPAQLELKPVQMGQLIQAALTLVRQSMPAHAVRVSCDIAPRLPDVLADENQMKQVFINLILNAFQAMPNGGEMSIRCSTRLLTALDEGVGRRRTDAFRPGEPGVICEVRDTGVGIPPEHVAKIFDPFFTTKPPGQGTGLGLAITRAIVEQHRGVITVESREGVGACLCVTLPVARKAAARGSTNGRAPSANGARMAQE
ncbi:MAG: PAS domain S-box protein [Candidatus Omnitrophica bacterium]|nr:PAS domain S-box protein [Candidatus Omnitrophota bacterium]